MLPYDVFNKLKVGAECESKFAPRQQLLRRDKLIVRQIFADFVYLAHVNFVCATRLVLFEFLVVNRLRLHSEAHDMVGLILIGHQGQLDEQINMIVKVVFFPIFVPQRHP